MLSERKDAFEKFWRAYPEERQSNKAAARIAYDLAAHSLAQEFGSEQAAYEHIQVRMERYASSPAATQERRKFCMNPKRWLEERHWEDSDAAWGYSRKPYGGSAISRQLAKAKAVDGIDQGALQIAELEERYGKDVDSLSAAEAKLLLPKSLMRMYDQRGASGTIRETLLKQISKRASAEQPIPERDDDHFEAVR